MFGKTQVNAIRIFIQTLHKTSNLNFQHSRSSWPSENSHSAVNRLHRVMGSLYVQPNIKVSSQLHLRRHIRIVKVYIQLVVLTCIDISVLGQILCAMDTHVLASYLSIMNTNVSTYSPSKRHEYKCSNWVYLQVVIGRFFSYFG